MLELPESAVLSAQLAREVAGRTIGGVQANASPHGFAWFYGDPAMYPGFLTGRVLGQARPVAGMVEIPATDRVRLVFGDGVNLRLIGAGDKRPAKHQLLLELDDGRALAASVQMYGGLWAFAEGGMDENGYYMGAKQKPSPLGEGFDEAYFEGLFAAAAPKLSAKAFLATEQRIPGLGNGVLQDILFLAGIHPARPIATLADADMRALYATVRGTLARMRDGGGRDTEKDLYGRAGGYRTLLSRKTLSYPCPKCGGPLQRKAYLGGNVYLCPVCQPLPEKAEKHGKT